MPLKSWKDMRNAAETDAPSFEPLPDGTYDFVIEKAEHRTSQKGKDGYNITAIVETGPYKKRKVFETFWISPESNAAMGIFFRQMGNLGLGNAFWDQEPDDNDIVAALASKRFQGTVTTEEYQGKKNNRINGVNPPANRSAVEFDGGAVTQAAASVAALSTPTATVTPVQTAKPVVEPQAVEVLPSPWDDVSAPTSSGVPSFGNKPDAPF